MFYINIFLFIYEVHEARYLPKTLNGVEPTTSCDICLYDKTSTKLGDYEVDSVTVPDSSSPKYNEEVLLWVI